MTQTFPIVPATTHPLWFWTPIAVLVLTTLLVGFLMGRTLVGSRNTVFELSAKGLQIRGDLYARHIPAEHIEADKAKAVNLDLEEGYRLKWKRNGTNMPGYSSGWWSLRNGEKALVFVTDPTRAVYVPTTEGYSLLFSVEDPKQVVQAIRNARS